MRLVSIHDDATLVIVPYEFQGQLRSPDVMGVSLMQSRVVDATPTFQKFNIMPMSAAWIK